jgi:serine acetyltransferase
MRRDIDRAVVQLGDDPSSLTRLSLLSTLRALFFCPALLAVLAYRCGHALHERLPGRTGALGWLFTRFAGHLVGVEFDPRVHAGPGLLVNHHGNVFVGALTIGENCNIAHGVTIGGPALNDAGLDDRPVIGDRVWIGANAVVAGSVRLDDDAVVSANSLVMRDVPAGGFAVGVPARILGHRGSFGQVRYRGMEDDPARLEAMHRLDVEPAPGADATVAAENVTVTSGRMDDMSTTPFTRRVARG